MAEYITKEEFDALREMVPDRVERGENLDYSFASLSDQDGKEIAFAAWENGVFQYAVLREQRLRARIGRAREDDFANLIEVIKFIFNVKWAYVSYWGHVSIRRESGVVDIERVDLARIALVL